MQLGNRQFQSSADVRNTNRDASMIANVDNVSTATAASAAASSTSVPPYERPISRGRQDTATRDLMLINNNQRSPPRRPPSTSFFAIFYERPVRHRYYRQINRSATNLVRRLSQSRLFLNSSRAHNAAYRSNFTRQSSRSNSAGAAAAADAATTAAPAEPADIQRHNDRAQSQPADSELAVMLDERNQIDDTDDDYMPQNENQSCNDNDNDSIIAYRARSIHSLNMSNDCNQNMVANRLSAIRSVASENDLFRNDERSETPPPPYNVAVHHRRV